jgi:hypothetical protein
MAARWTQLGIDEILHSPYVLIGTVDELDVVFEPYVDAFAPVVARLAGR